MSGVIPAIPLILIRPFLPESPIWQQKKQAGTLKRPSIAALFAPELRRTTIVTTIMFAMAYGAAFGAIQQIPQIVPGLPEVREMTQGQTPPEARLIEQRVASDVTKVQEIGGLVGRTLLAVLAVYIVSRRKLIRMFQIPGLILMPIVFGYVATPGSAMALCRDVLRRAFHRRAVQFLGELPAARVSRAPARYRRKLCRQHRRPVDRHLVRLADRDTRSDHRPRPRARKSCDRRRGGRFSVYLVGLIASFFLPEPPQEELH